MVGADHMFFWASRQDLKPFRKHFDELATKSTSKTFVAALKWVATLAGDGIHTDRSLFPYSPP